MELSQTQTAKVIAALLLLMAILQPIYIALFVGFPDLDLLSVWRLEGIIFVLLAAFSGSALVMAQRHALGFSAIAFSAIFKLLAIGIGLTQFIPFRAAANLNTDLGDVAASMTAFSFFCYCSANMLLGLAAAAFGKSKLDEGARALGRAAVLFGAGAFVTNSLVMMFGFQGFFPAPVAGGFAVIATVLLAVCVLNLSKEEAQ
jgi:hypothetical protein